jgi:hypothetical protein
MEDGRWKMEDGRWKMEDGVFFIVGLENTLFLWMSGFWNGRLKMENGRCFSSSIFNPNIFHLKNALFPKRSG